MSSLLEKDDLEDEKCENDHYVGDCIGLTWNQQMECRCHIISISYHFAVNLILTCHHSLSRWFLTDTECNLKERFICERDPQ